VSSPQKRVHCTIVWDIVNTLSVIFCIVRGSRGRSLSKPCIFGALTLFAFRCLHLFVYVFAPVMAWVIPLFITASFDFLMRHRASVRRAKTYPNVPSGTAVYRLVPIGPTMYRFVRLCTEWYKFVFL